MIQWYDEVLAIRRIFSLDNMITNTKFSNRPTVYKLLQINSKICIYIVSNKTRFKAKHHLQNSENVRFLLPTPILRLYTGCRLDQTLSKCIASFKKVKVLKC